jgi:hypothetical protein
MSCTDSPPETLVAEILDRLRQDHDAVLAADRRAKLERLGEAITALLLLNACKTPQERLAHLKALGVSCRTPLSWATRACVYWAAADVWHHDGRPRTSSLRDWMPADVRKLVQRCGPFSYAKLHAALAASDADARARRHAKLKPEKVAAGLRKAMTKAIAALETADGAVAGDLRDRLRVVLGQALDELQAPPEIPIPLIFPDLDNAQDELVAPPATATPLIFADLLNALDELAATLEMPIPLICPGLGNAQDELVTPPATATPPIFTGATVETA